MKIARFTEYGPAEVIRFEEQDVPTAGAGQLLVKVHSTAVTVADSRIRGANFPKGYGLIAKPLLGLFKPNKNVQILGSIYSGEVVKTGSGVTSFNIGEMVMGMKSPPNLGTYAEFIVVDEKSAVAHKPDSLSHNDAAGLLFGATTALYFLRDLGAIKKGDKVLVVGASGAVGTNAVQLAKYYGAVVTGVCSTKNIQLVKDLGADYVIDYTQEKILGSGSYDLVLNVAPGLDVNQLTSLVSPGGKVLVVLSDLWGLLQAMIPLLRNSSARSTDVKAGVAPERKEDVVLLADLSAKGVLKVVIDKVYPFDEIVDAHRHVDTGHKVGNVVLEMT